MSREVTQAEPLAADKKKINVAIAGDRLSALHCVIKSISKSTRNLNVHLWLISDIPGLKTLGNSPYAKRILEIGKLAGLTVLTMKDVEVNLKAHGLSPIWDWTSFGSSLAPGWANEKTLPLESWDGAVKNMSPYNHVRFYLPQLTWFQDLDRLIVLDDDVIIQKDLSLLLRQDMAPGRVIGTTCEKWQSGNSPVEKKFLAGQARFNNSDDLYMHDMNEPRSRSLFVPLIKSINHLGPHALDQEIDWNFGIALVDVQQWRDENITQLYHQWMFANYQKHLATEGSVVFGSGIPQLALLKRHQCLQEPELHIAEGLGYITLNTLRRNRLHYDKFVGHAFALHYSGPNKPWDNSSNNAFRKPYTDLFGLPNDDDSTFRSPQRHYRRHHEEVPQNHHRDRVPRSHHRRFRSDSYGDDYYQADRAPGPHHGHHHRNYYGDNDHRPVRAPKSHNRHHHRSDYEDDDHRPYRHRPHYNEFPQNRYRNQVAERRHRHHRAHRKESHLAVKSAHQDNVTSLEKEKEKEEMDRNLQNIAKDMWVASG